MVQRIFDWVAQSLVWAAKLVGLSYNDVNIIVYYAIIPFTWAFMIDRLFRFHYVKTAWAALILTVFIGCGNFHAFCDRLFILSARWLSSFGWCGMNYVVASVVFCVLLPALVYAVLGYLIWKQRTA